MTFTPQTLKVLLACQQLFRTLQYSKGVDLNRLSADECQEWAAALEMVDDEVSRWREGA